MNAPNQSGERIMKELAPETLKRFVEAMNRHDAATAVQMYTDDVVFWEPTYEEPRRGRDAVRRELEGFFAMLPDIHFTTEAILTDGNRLFHEWSYRATYNGRPIELRECSVNHFDVDGRIAEVRVYFDRMSLMRQLGLAPEV